MDKKLRGKVSEVSLDVHNNYNYDHKAVDAWDDFVFKRGNEAVNVRLSHPHVEKLEESSHNPNVNGEWIAQSWDKGHHQHTFWDKPYGRSTGPVVTGLHATPGARADVATALGAVTEHSIKKFGAVPAASSDLSKHSLPIVQRLEDVTREKGIKGVSSPRYPSNDTDKLAGDVQAKQSAANAFKVYPYLYKDIPEEKLTSGSKLMRGLFAGRHLNKQQFTQPELPFGDK